MTAELTQEIAAKLAQLVKLLAVSTTRGLPRSEQMALLSRAGLSVGEIADILDVKPNAVSVALYNVRHKRKPKG